MPRETILDSYACFDVKVGWSRDAEYVQLATEMREPQTSDSPQTLRDLVLSWGGAPDGKPADTGAMGLYATLNRHSINELIRVLRRARDQAFGRDE